MSDLSALFDLSTSPAVISAHPLRWGAPTAIERGPVIANRDPAQRNAIGAHAGGYGVYRALAIAAGDLPSNHRPDLTDTAPAVPTVITSPAMGARSARRHVPEGAQHAHAGHHVQAERH